jgi:urease accessory protein
MQVSSGLTDVFAENRAVGRVACSVERRAGATRRARLFETGPLRLRCPKSSHHVLEAVIINTAGGIAGGDRLHIDLKIAKGSRLTVTTAAAEKVYRTLGEHAIMDIHLKVETGAALAWLPQETILFDQARLNRSIHIDLAKDAQLVFAEGIVFGRSGRGEQVSQGHLADHWLVHRDGRLLHAEAARFDGAIAEKLGHRAVAAGNVGVATVLMYPGDEKVAEALRTQEFCGEVGISAWKGIAIARLCAPDGAMLKRDLVALIRALPDTPEVPRLWSN